MPLSGQPHPEQRVSALVVVLPVGPQRSLAAHVPDVEPHPAQQGMPCLCCRSSSKHICLESKYELRFSCSPFELQGVDVEAERGADLGGVLASDLLDHGCLTSVVKAPYII